MGNNILERLINLNVIDLRKTDVVITFDCLKNHPTDTAEFIYILLNNVTSYKHLYSYKNINEENVKRLIEIFEKERRWLSERLSYTRKMNKQIIEDKGWDKNTYVVTGNPQIRLTINLSELITFYNILELYEDNFSIINKDLSFTERIFFIDTDIVKNMLTQRLGYAILSNYDAKVKQINKL